MKSVFPDEYYDESKRLYAQHVERVNEMAARLSGDENRQARIAELERLGSVYSDLCGKLADNYRHKMLEVDEDKYAEQSEGEEDQHEPSHKRVRSGELALLRELTVIAARKFLKGETR
jgi:hypothetical protein